MDPINDAIQELEKRQEIIIGALTVLRRIGPVSVQEPQKSKHTAESRRKIAAAQRRRWKAQKAA